MRLRPAAPPVLPLALLLALAPGACTVVGYPSPSPPPPSSSAGVPDPGVDSEVPRETDDPSSSDRAPVDVYGNLPLPEPEPRSRYGNPPSYEVDGRTYRVLDRAEGYEEEGLASWYGDEFAGRRTSSGETFDPELLTAAHRTLPLPSWVEVTSLTNGRSVVVRVNDRGPFADPDERIIDLSEAAARRLGMIGAGTARVRVRVLVGPLEDTGPGSSREAGRPRRDARRHGAAPAPGPD